MEVLWSGVGAGISLHLLVVTAELQWELGGKLGVRLLQDPYCNAEVEWKTFLTHPASLESTFLGRV